MSSPRVGFSLQLRRMDYSIVQQCMHCGMCLPTCPTYEATRIERHSPRGRIALMRAVADERLDLTRVFAEEMYFCLGCLACQTACPAGVDYARLFETARADIERSGVLASRQRNFWRGLTLKILFMRPRLLRLAGRLLWLYQASGFQRIFRALGGARFLPAHLRELEPQTPDIQARFSHQRIRPIERPQGSVRWKVGLLTGCVQDLVFSDVNRATVDVLLANGCEVLTPPVQPCCGSLHAHNGEPELAAQLARRLIAAFPLHELDAIITNAGGCGSHLRHYGHLLAEDSAWAEQARLWDSKVKDIHEWLVEIGFRPPRAAPPGAPLRVTYHDSCHLAHGQRVVAAPRAILQAIPGVELIDLPESNWCCGSAGIYNITHPAMARELQQRKIRHILSTSCSHVATANPGCHLQIATGLTQHPVCVTQPVQLLADAYRAEASS